MDPELPYFLGFSAFPGIGPVRFRLLYTYFSSAKSAWNASRSELIHIGMGNVLIDAFVAFRKRTNVDHYVEELTHKHIGALMITDPRYPALLKEIPDPPFVLYVRGTRGKTTLDMSRPVGVVGTRSMSSYGKDVTERIVSGLVAEKCTIVSGMAYGVDAVAHQAALDGGGMTVAVLGCGVDVIAPVSNDRLYHEIIECGRGAVLSEMPLGMRPNKGVFPARNRIISGLSRGIVVTEGAAHSGAMITARYAAEQGRDVFAVPGPITSLYSKGPAKLLKDGATLVESAADILEALQMGHVSNDATGKQGQIADTNEERCILDRLTEGSMHIDNLVRSTGLTASNVAAILTILEMKGLVKDIGEKEYSLM